MLFETIGSMMSSCRKNSILQNVYSMQVFCKSWLSLMLITDIYLFWYPKCSTHFAEWNFFYNLTSYFQSFQTTWLISALNINQSTFGIVLDGIIWTLFPRCFNSGYEKKYNKLTCKQICTLLHVDDNVYCVKVGSFSTKVIS